MTRRDQSNEEPSQSLYLTCDSHGDLSVGPVYTYCQFICICTRRHACGPSDVPRARKRTIGQGELKAEGKRKVQKAEVQKRGRKVERKREKKDFPFD